MTGPGRRILYIDDDEATRRLVQRDLRRHGCEVTLAADGREGETLAAAARFDLICLDHHMPGQDGLETLARLRDLADPPPVIFVTGSEDGRLAVAALRAGAADYVIKDAGGQFLDLLRATVEDALDRDGLRRAKDQALLDLQAARIRAEELAEQRAVLLQEVNHRVANSLQLITALLLLQEAAIAEPATRSALAEVRSRIFAVAQVHQRLYTSDDVRVVALDEYLGGLLAELERSFDAAGRPRLRYQAEAIRIDTDRAVSLGVILAELVTNAVKYAYPNDAGGEVRVTLRREDGEAVLRVEDDGVGLGAAEAPAGTGLGQRVIRAMGESCGARVERSGGPGLTVAVRFTLNEAC